jgi:hypothetical protein
VALDGAGTTRFTTSRGQAGRCPPSPSARSGQRLSPSHPLRFPNFPNRELRARPPCSDQIADSRAAPRRSTPLHCVRSLRFGSLPALNSRGPSIRVFPEAISSRYWTNCSVVSSVSRCALIRFGPDASPAEPRAFSRRFFGYPAWIFGSCVEIKSELGFLSEMFDPGTRF